MSLNRTEFTEQEMKLIESAIATFERFGIRVMAEITRTGFHIVIPVEEIVNYFKRVVKEPEQLRIDARSLTVGSRAYIDIQITKR